MWSYQLLSNHVAYQITSSQTTSHDINFHRIFHITSYHFLSMLYHVTLPLIICLAQIPRTMSEHVILFHITSSQITTLLIRSYKIPSNQHITSPHITFYWLMIICITSYHIHHITFSPHIHRTKSQDIILYYHII